MYVYSDGVEDALLESARIRRTRDLGQTLAELNERYGGHADVLLIHSGAEVVPELPIHNRL